MGKALYRKYRSSTLEEVVGQSHITTVLNNSLKSGNVSHAYIFTGPRGVGKTSIARIFARSVNKLLPNDDNFYTDIIEIDAASNRRIDEIRELREKVIIAPSQLKYKVYIIDEVHMLTREAFNALLKTLEEPPDHAIFILATTDFYKVPETIVSRCIRFTFKPITVNDISKHLKSIAERENIKVNDDALKIIAEHSDGGLRDAISIFDQLSNADQLIDESLVESMLGIANDKLVADLLTHVSTGDLAKVLATIDDLYETGATSEKLFKQINDFLRDALISGSSKFKPDEIISTLEELGSSYNYTDQRLGLEIGLLKTASSKSTPVEPVQPRTIKSDKITTPEIQIDELKPLINTEPVALPADPIPNTDSKSEWQEILDKIKLDNTSIYRIARMAEANIVNTKLELSFRFALHFNQMSLEKNKTILYKAITDSNSSIENISITLKDGNNLAKEKSSPKTTSLASKEDISSISNIFGSAEVLES